MPEVGDEVLVGFEFGDVRRAYVLGGLGNGNDRTRPRRGRREERHPGRPVVVKRGLGQPAGHKILIDDDGDGNVPPSKSGITIGTADDKS